MADDGLRFLWGGALRVAEIDFMVFSAHLVSLLLDKFVEPFDHRAFSRIRADVHDLRRPAFRKPLEPAFRKPWEFRFFLDGLDCLGDVVLRHDVGQDDEYGPLPVLTFLVQEIGDVVGAPQSFERHHRVVDGLFLLEREFERVGDAVSGLLGPVHLLIRALNRRPIKFLKIASLRKVAKSAIVLEVLPGWRKWQTQGT